MKKFFACIFFLSLLFNYSMAQPDTIQIRHKPFLKKQILPLGLIAGGALLNTGTIKNDIQNWFPCTHIKADDYFQYVPMAQIYIFDALGIKHQNDIFCQTKYLAISFVASSAIVHAIKPLAKVKRPSGAEKSFPSGHTSLAFVGATSLYHEFIDTKPLLAYSGFVFAGATAILRVTNNKHWLPDVLAGAGIGILTVNLVYHFEPLKNWQPFKKNKELSFTPLVSSNSLGLVCRF